MERYKLKLEKKGEAMPFKSQAQRSKFGELVAQGKMSQDEFDKWQAETPPDLPERITKPKPEKPNTPKPPKPSSNVVRPTPVRAMLKTNLPKPVKTIQAKPVTGIADIRSIAKKKYGF